jgi:hypothetical protein
MPGDILAMNSGLNEHPDAGIVGIDNRSQKSSLVSQQMRRMIARFTRRTMINVNLLSGAL